MHVDNAYFSHMIGIFYNRTYVINNHIFDFKLCVFITSLYYIGLLWKHIRWYGDLLMKNELTACTIINLTHMYNRIFYFVK